MGPAPSLPARMNERIDDWGCVVNFAPDRAVAPGDVGYYDEERGRFVAVAEPAGGGGARNYSVCERTVVALPSREFYPTQTTQKRTATYSVENLHRRLVALFFTLPPLRPQLTLALPVQVLSLHHHEGPRPPTPKMLLNISVHLPSFRLSLTPPLALTP